MVGLSGQGKSEIRFSADLGWWTQTNDKRQPTPLLESGKDSRAFNRSDLSRMMEGVELPSFVYSFLPPMPIRPRSLARSRTWPHTQRNNSHTSHKSATQGGGRLGVVGGLGGDWSVEPTSRTAAASPQQPKHPPPQRG